MINLEEAIKRTFVIEPQKRTIYIDYGACFGRPNISKYKLNFPYMMAQNRPTPAGRPSWYLFAVDNENYEQVKICFPPLLNVNESCYICTGVEASTIQDFKKALFCTYFNTECTIALRQYVSLEYEGMKAIDRFYRHWEQSGKVTLKPLDYICKQLNSPHL